MWIGKRQFDILFSLVALICLFPLFLMISLWIKWDSKGPIFFRQVRVGLNGKPFRIHKFRTMRTDAESLGPQITVGQDVRITQSGKFLRRFKVDELPQFIDVFCGTMSVVGPRPEVPKYVDQYPAEIKGVALSVRPGITDKASLEFKDENDILGASHDPERDYVEKILPVKLAYHVDYARNATMGTDLKLIFRTVKEIFISR